MRHLRRAHELLDSHGFGSDAGYPRENDFGAGLEDWWKGSKNIDGEDRMTGAGLEDWWKGSGEDRMTNLPEDVMENIYLKLDDYKKAKMLRTMNTSHRSAGETYFEEEANKRAQDPKALLQAVNDNDALMVDLLLKRGLAVDKDMLKLAVKNQNLKIVESLLDKKREWSLDSRDWESLIRSALRRNYKEPPLSVVEVLLTKVNTNDEPNNLNEAFNAFISYIDRGEWKHEETLRIVEKFLSKGAKYTNDNLTHCILKGKFDSGLHAKIAQLMEKYPANKVDNLFVELFVAIQEDGQYTAESLLREKKPIPDGFIMKAVEKGKMKILKLMLDKGEDETISLQLKSSFDSALQHVSDGSAEHAELANLIIERAGELGKLDELLSVIISSMIKNYTYDYTHAHHRPVFRLYKELLRKGARCTEDEYNMAKEEFIPHVSDLMTAETIRDLRHETGH